MGGLSSRNRGQYSPVYPVAKKFLESGSDLFAKFSYPTFGWLLYVEDFGTNLAVIKLHKKSLIG